jgi:TetR/AcrR family fatty acid metabolism transcriptional regulator
MAKEKTKERIIEAAAKLFAEQGYVAATVSQIARLAKVSDATVYEHFGGKEGILMQIPARWVSENAPVLEDHLFGIKGAVNKIRKYVWEYAKNVAENPTYAKVVFFYIKTNEDFQKTDAHAVVRNSFRKIVDLIEQGIKDGEIRSDIDPYSARMLILGTLEHMFIRWLLKGCKYDLFEQLEKTFSLIEFALKADH